MIDMHANSSSDPVVDEVRRIRADICEQTGHDVDQLCDHLLEVSRDFDDRRGVFSAVTEEAAARVAESWGENAHDRKDSVVDEDRAIRQRRTDRR